MSEVIFNDRTNEPDDIALAEALGTAHDYWREIGDHVLREYADTREEWKCYGKKYGWQLKTFLKKRNLFFRIPYESFFKVVFVFGDKAVNEIEKSDIAEELKAQVAAAKKYMEGRGLAMDVKDDTFMADIRKLIRIKIEN